MAKAPDGWRVIAQRNTERYINSTQTFEQVVEVTIQAEDGTTKVLVVPEGRYNADNVVDLGNAWIEQHRAIATLGNG